MTADAERAVEPAPEWWAAGKGGKCLCQTYWSGLRTIHCITCHETFTAPSALDRHRANYQCRPPADVGLVRVDSVRVERHGITELAWGFPTVDVDGAPQWRDAEDGES